MMLREDDSDAPKTVFLIAPIYSYDRIRDQANIPNVENNGANSDVLFYIDNIIEAKPCF